MFDNRFARQNCYGLPPEFPLASTYTRIVHHLSGLNMYALASPRLIKHGTSRYCAQPVFKKTIRTEIVPKPEKIQAFSFNAPLGFVRPNDSRTCSTPWSVFQDGTGNMLTISPRIVDATHRDLHSGTQKA